MVWSCWPTKGWTGGNIISLISLNPLLFKKKIAHVGVFMQFVFVFVWATQGIHWYIIFGTFVVFVFVFVLVILADLKIEIFYSFQPYLCMWQSFYIFLVFRFCSFWCFCIFAPLSAVWLPVQMTRVELEGEFFLFAFLGFPKLEAALDCNFLEKITGSSFGNKSWAGREHSFFSHFSVLGEFPNLNKKFPKK